MSNEKGISKLEGNEIESVAGGETYYLFDGREDQAAADQKSPFEILDKNCQTLYRCPTKDGAKDLFRSIHPHDELKVLNWDEVQSLRKNGQVPRRNRRTVMRNDFWINHPGMYGSSND